MTKIDATGAAPVSKYAAKRAKLAKAAKEEAIKKEAIANNQEIEIAVEKHSDTDITKKVQQEVEKVISEPTIVDKVRKIKPKKNRDIPSTAFAYPEHMVQIALLIKNNAEIRRFTSLGILNYLYQKGEIKGTDGFVSFKWNKFAVKYKGLMKEYFYNEPFFLNSLVASFTSFSASAQRTIDKFCKTELMVGINKAVDAEEVEQIAEMNEQHQANAKADVNDKTKE